VDAAREALAAAGCSVLVVSQAKPEQLARYAERYGWRVPLAADPERAAYRAFGLERTSWLTFFRPRVLWGYFRGMLRGYGVKKPYAGEDMLQLGGDFVLDRRRRVVFAYPSADPADRPGVPAVLAALPSAPPMGREPAPDSFRPPRP
jgi:peroxiredoxin